MESVPDLQYANWLSRRLQFRHRAESRSAGSCRGWLSRPCAALLDRRKATDAGSARSANLRCKRSAAHWTFLLRSKHILDSCLLCEHGASGNSRRMPYSDVWELAAEHV